MVGFLAQINCAYTGGVFSGYKAPCTNTQRSSGTGTVLIQPVAVSKTHRQPKGVMLLSGES